MKKQINPTIKAHLIRGAFYLLLLLAICAIPFALAQRNTAKQSLAKPVGAYIPQVAHSSDRTLSADEALAMKLKPAGNPAALTNAELLKNPLATLNQRSPLIPLAYTEKAPYPFSGGVDRHATASFNNFLYAIGGEFFNGSTFAITDKLQRFDPVGNAWVELAPMPSVYDNNEACAMNGKIYVPGGYAGSGPPFSAVHFRITSTPCALDRATAST